MQSQLKNRLAEAFRKPNPQSSDTVDHTVDDTKVCVCIIKGQDVHMCGE